MTQRKTNRKVLFCCCMLVLAVCTAGLGTYTYLLKVMKVDYLVNVGFLPLILTIIMFMAYGFGVIPTLHLINSEVFPGRSRSLGCGISLSFEPSTLSTLKYFRAAAEAWGVEFPCHSNPPPYQL